MPHRVAPPGSTPSDSRRPRSGASAALLTAALIVAALAILAGGAPTAEDASFDRFEQIAPADDGRKLLLSDVGLSPGSISPPYACPPSSSDGIQDETGIRYRVIWPDSIYVGLFIDSADGSPRGWIQSWLKQASSQNYSVPFDGCLRGGTSSNMLSDGFYFIHVRAMNDTGRKEIDTLHVEIDRVPPVVLSIVEETGATTFRNGDTVVIEARMDRPNYQVTPDFSRLDSDTAAITTVTDRGDGSYLIRHYISEDNQKPDGRALVVPITFRDLAGNQITDRSLKVCLLNHPPEPVSAAFKGGVNIFKNGGRIELETWWRSPNTPLTVSADFHGIDGNYDSTKVTVSNLADGGEGLSGFGITYTISADNYLESRADYLLTLRARDAACGEAAISLVMELDNKRPAAPVLDPVATTTRNASIAVTGKAVEAHGVIFKRSTTVLDTVPIGADGRFEAALALNAGENSLTAEALDAAGNKSTATSFSVYRLTEAFVTIPARFTPGSTFKLGLSRPGRSVRVELWSLSGDLIRVLEDDAARDIYTLTWDGRNGSGEIVNSGPVLSLTEIAYADGTSETVKRAILLVKTTP